MRLRGDHWVPRALRHPIAAGAGALAASQYAGAVLGLVTMAVAARLLGPRNYGIAALVIAYPSLLLSFVSLKTSMITNYLSGLRATGQNDLARSLCKLGYGLDLGASLISLVLVAITGGLVARSLYGLEDIHWMMIVYAGSFPIFSLAGTSGAILASRQRFGPIALSQLIDRGTSLAFVGGLLLAGLGIPGMIVGMTVGHVAGGLASVSLATYVMHREGMGPWWKASLADIRSIRREIAAFFGWNYLSATLTGIMAQVPLMILGSVRGPQEAGFFRLSTSLVNVGTYLESSLGWASYPILSQRLGMGETESISGSLRRWSLKAGLPASLLVLVAVTLLPVVVPIAFGAGFSSAVPGAQLMLAGAAVSTAFFWLIHFFYASGNIALWTKSHGAHTIFVIAVGWLAVEQLGFLGLAGTVAAGRVLFTLWLLILIRIRKGHL